MLYLHYHLKSAHAWGTQICFWISPARVLHVSWSRPDLCTVKCSKHLMCDVVTADSTNIGVFRSMTSCMLVGWRLHFGGTIFVVEQDIKIALLFAVMLVFMYYGSSRRISTCWGPDLCSTYLLICLHFNTCWRIIVRNVDTFAEVCFLYYVIPINL